MLGVRFAGVSFTLGIEIFNEGYAQFLSEILEFVKILLVLLLIFDFGLDAYLSN